MALASVLSKRTGAQFQPDGAVNIVASTLTGATSMGFWADRATPQRRLSFVGASGITNQPANLVDITPLLPHFYNTTSSGDFSVGISVANVRVDWRLDQIGTATTLPTTGNIQINLRTEGIDPTSNQPFVSDNLLQNFDVATQLTPYQGNTLQSNQTTNGIWKLEGIAPQTTKLSLWAQWAGCPGNTDCYLTFSQAFAMPLAPVFTNEVVVLPPVVPKPPNVVLYPNP